jgi:hypothetical protein
MVGTIATAVLIVIAVFIGQTSTNGGLVESNYFVQLDTRNLNIKDALAGGTFGDIVDRVGAGGANNIQGGGSAKELGVSEWYRAGFFGYCTGHFNKDQSTTTDNCTTSKAYFIFNIVDIINEGNNGKRQNLTFPSEVNKVLKTFGSLSRISFTLFAIGLLATVIEFAVGWFGLLSRWGSCCTTIVANVAFIALFGGALFNTIVYSLMAASFNKTYGQFGVKAEFHRHTYAIMWLGVAISFGAAFFWLLSTCCCSGRRDRIVRGDKNGKRSAYGNEKPFGQSEYQRVPSPYTAPLMGEQSHGTVGGGPHPGASYPTTYEPMRHQQV